jgi:hypothetical protein
MQHQLLAFEAVRRAPATPLGGALKPLLGGNVENEGDVRQQPADREPLQGVDQGLRHTGRRPLIGARRIEEAVAHHPLAVEKRLPDGVLDVIASRHREQQGLGERTELPNLPREQGFANFLGSRRAAGLAGGKHLAAGARQTIGENAGLGRLAGALAALECDESAGVHRLALHRSRYSNQPNASTSSESRPRMAKLLWSTSSPA